MQKAFPWEACDDLQNLTCYEEKAEKNWERNACAFVIWISPIASVDGLFSPTRCASLKRLSPLMSKSAEAPDNHFHQLRLDRFEFTSTNWHGVQMKRSRILLEITPSRSHSRSLFLHHFDFWSALSISERTLPCCSNIFMRRYSCLACSSGKLNTRVNNNSNWNKHGEVEGRHPPCGTEVSDEKHGRSARAAAVRRKRITEAPRFSNWSWKWIAESRGQIEHHK